MKRSTRLASSIQLILAASTAFGHAALAEEASQTQIEEVVVTAQKRVELLSKVPVAVSAVSQDRLDDLGIRSTRDLVTAVPSLQTSVNGYTTQFSIRGIGNFSGSYSTVAVQVDGIYEPNIGALSNALYDVGRIEVLRGPQGTVYGRNATAGVVNINTADPTDEAEVYGDVAYGNYSDFTVRGVANLPLGDRVQLRGSVVRQTNDGYYPGGLAGDDYAKTDLLSGQLTGLVTITDDLTWRLAVSHARNEGTVNYLHGVKYLYYPNANLTTGVLGDPQLVPARDNLFGQENEPENQLDTEQTAVRSRLTWSLSDTITATYLAGYSTFSNDGVTQATGAFSSRQRDFETRSTTQELDINYEAERLKAVLGLYYYSDNADGNSALHIGNTVPWPLNTLVPNAINQPTGTEPSVYGLIDILQRTRDSENTSEAAFAQATYSITDRVRLTGGVRYTSDSSSIDQASQVCAFGTGWEPNAQLRCGVPFGPPSTTKQSTDSSNTSWKTTLDMDLTPDQLLYLTVGTGYRGGGVSGNTSLPAQFLSYDPETVTNYELGWKANLLGRSLVLTLSAFNMDYEDMQVSAIELDLNGNPTPVTINAAEARLRGVEAELDWRITRFDEIRGYVTYLDTQFKSFPNGVNSSTNPDGIYNNTIRALNTNTGSNYALLPINVPTNFTGNEIPNAPSTTVRLAYSRLLELGDVGTLAPTLQWYWQDDSYADLANSAQSQRKSYSKVDMIVTFRSPSERLMLEAYGYNLTDKTVLQSANAKWDQTVGFYMPPRTYGLRVGYRFQ